MTYREAHVICDGKWEGILAAAGVDPALLGEGKACPACGGDDRFSFFGRADGFWLCRQCNPGGGDGFKLLAAVGVDRSIEFAVREAGGSPRKKASRGQDDAAKLQRVTDTLEGCVMPWGTLTEDYLAARGIPRAAWSGLRHHEALTGAGVARPGLPAMVAVVERPSGEVCTLHRTFLSVGAPQKADIGSPKQLMPVAHGSWIGSAVRLSALPVGSPALGVGSPTLALPVGSPGSAIPFGSPSQALVIGEGIESTLSAGIILEAPAWATLTAGGMEGWEPPEGLQASRIIVAGDSDASGVGQAAAHALASRLWRLGWVADVMFPPDGFSDWNDVLMEGVSDGEELEVGGFTGRVQAASTEAAQA